MAAKRRWGYLVWVVAGVVIAVPELAAAAGRTLPFKTISGMVGHLERHHTWVELLVVAAMVFVIFSTLRLRPEKESGGEGQPARTPGGRLTVRGPADQTPKEFDDEDAPGIFAGAAVVALAAVAVGTWAASEWWDDAHHYQPAYVLYGSLAVLFLVVPSLVALALGKDPPFPTLFRSVANLEEWLKSRPWPHSLGPWLGWLVAYVILAGLVILMLHLALYPYPDITRIINPNG